MIKDQSHIIKRNRHEGLYGAGEMRDVDVNLPD